MSASTDSVISFYDIILDPAAYPGSPNPWKTRYALNFAKVPYRTTWVPLNAVAETRNSLQLPANRKHMDGSDFPTLPIIRDPRAHAADKKEIVLGDTFDIALHLQKSYLSSPSTSPSQQLFPADGSGTVALHRAFNKFADELFSRYGAPLAGCYMPFDPRTEEADKKAMMDRFPGKTKWEEFEIPRGSDVRKKFLKDFEEALDTKLGPCFAAAADDGKGPFMDGQKTPMYADFIIGGWLQMMRGCLPEWEELRDKWSGGKWGRLFDALEEWARVDGRDGVVPARR
ncbi:hypothetical protein K4K56_008061 [Colletotrichum sp. SAR 10_98]|nr:hypothetical protein K4K56_008061 [Colletotrichum sp. SAR 10_98]